MGITLQSSYTTVDHNCRVTGAVSADTVEYG